MKESKNKDLPCFARQNLFSRSAQNSPELVVILDNIRSTYNVGAIFRTADAAGVLKIYLCGITPSPPNPKISKVALGAEKFIPFEKIKNTWRLLEELKDENYFLISIEQGKNSKDIFKITSKILKRKKIALILGPEVKGLSSKILKRTNLQLEIPMHGKKESLNVAVAFGVAVYQMRNLL
ncbi:MAG: TrmH family RNA methyltransferase [Candidatus Paceibacterota bacterium]|jgi:tRNA G18 (ribose-2'-O)-methylase SpoU